MVFSQFFKRNLEGILFQTIRRHSPLELVQPPVCEPRSKGAHDVGSREVVSLEQQRISGVAGERVRAAIAQVQSGGVTTLAVSFVCIARETEMVGGKGNHLELGAMQQQIELSRAAGALA